MSTSATPSALPTPEPAANDNSFSRLIGAIISPKATFESIARRPTWLLPILLIVAGSLLLVGIFSQRVGWRSMIIRQDEQNSRVQKQMENMTTEQRDNMIDTQTKFAAPFAYGFTVVGPFIALVVVAAVLMLAFTIILGTKVGFKQSLGIVSYSWTPGLIGILLGILILFLKDPSTIDLEHLVATNAGAFLSDSAPKWLNTLLTSCDLFTFWNMILMAFGFSAIDPKKVSWGKAFATVFGLWVVFVLVKTGFSAAFS
jgi:hypothetical protein